MPGTPCLMKALRSKITGNKKLPLKGQVLYASVLLKREPFTYDSMFKSKSNLVLQSQPPSNQ
jgi:hypothetical protein